MQDEKAQLGVGLHVLFDEGRVVDYIPTVGSCSRYVVVDMHLATRKDTAIHTELFVLHDSDVRFLDSILYVHLISPEVIRL
jgi:hypothetical protein